MPAHPFRVEAARLAERASALRLAFQHLPAEDRETRVFNAMNLLHQGELDPDGILVARGRGELLGAMVCLPLPGASGLVWLPQAINDPGREELEDGLVVHALAWLRRRGAKMAQALVPPEESHLAGPLLRNGLRLITGLWYMRHHLDGLPDGPARGARLRYRTYKDGDQDVFHQTLLRSYEKTLDCPELNGVRELDEIIEGHKAQGRHDPGRWWLAREAGRPVGVLLLTEMPEWDGWDLAYVGVVPEARGRGLGRELTRKALTEARAAGATQVTLAVDARNRPAWDLYRGLGFTPYDRREVYLAIWR
jgi:ribosomal protein S18 acetylase RimI-like enzyme